MRGAELRAHGEPPVVEELPDPTAGPGQVEIEVSAVPLTPLDVLCATGRSYFGEPALPYVPGVQGIGRVASGERVWFPTSAGMAPGDGSMAERAVADRADLVPVPEAVDDTLAAALGLSAVAAWVCLTERARMRPGDRVLVLGAGGVVGQVGVQAARLLGAGTVHAVSRSEGGLARAGSLSADGVLGLDDAEDVAELAARLRDTCGEVDVVLDPLGGTPGTAALRCLAPGGRQVNLGASAGDDVVVSSAHLRSGSRVVLGHTNNDLTREQRAAAFAAIFDHAAAGRLTVDHEVVPLADVGPAWVRQAHDPGRRSVLVP